MLKTYPAIQTSWSPALVVDIAINEASSGAPLYTNEDLCEMYNLSIEEFEELRTLSAFKKDVRDALIEVRANGLTPKKKMAILYEYILDNQIPQWLADDEFPATEKVKIFVHLGKGSGLVVDKPEEKSTASQVPTLNIILTQEAPANTVTIVPQVTTIDQTN